MSNGTSQTTPRSVRFSQWSEMTVVPQHHDLEDRWHSKDDYADFKKKLIVDIRRSSGLFASTPADMLSQDELEACVGIESFLRLDLTRHLHEKKQAHVAAVVAGQRVLGEEQLSVVAEASSRWATHGALYRARGIGGPVTDAMQE